MSNSGVIKHGRRHFLMGLGGLALAIPFLPSLEKKASAGPAKAKPKFFFVSTGHGGAWDANFFPTSPTPNRQSVTGVSGHQIASGALSASGATSGGATSISPVLTASASTLTPALLAKMNVLRGLDVPWYLGHNTGLLGNFARNDANSGDGGDVAAIGGRPTIDQVMASSPSFYASGDAVAAKSLILGGGATQPYSWAATTPGDPSGGVTPVSNSLSSLPLFQSLFGMGGPAMKTPRKPVVDSVLQNYKSLMGGSSRLSAADKLRLGQHVDMLHTIEQSLDAKLSCSSTPPAPADNDVYSQYGATPNAKKWGQLYMDVAVAALACGATRIGVFGFGDTAGLSPGFIASGKSDWHQDAAHQWYTDAAQAWLVESYQGFFEHVFVYLASALDALTDSDGNTLLDNSLLVWGQECCMETHSSFGLQTVTFGGAGGNMKTGLYCDYRQVGQASSAINPGKDAGAGASSALDGYVTYPGLLWEQFLATSLLAMGVPASEWERWKDPSGNVEHGYGVPFVDATGTWETNYASHYLPGASSWAGGTPNTASSPYFANASQPLPFLMG